VPDAIFDVPRLAAIYDALDDDRSDLDVYDALVAEHGAASVLDVGCGTGTFACMLAKRGLDVVGVDPATASLDVAASKPHAERVRWIHGDATDLPPMAVDLATMTGNVAQVFLGDDEWTSTLLGIREALRPGGRLVFETRDPARRAWLGWNRAETLTRTIIPGAGAVTTWYELIDVSEPLVTFRSTNIFESDGVVLTSDSTLRFRTRDEVERSLDDAGYELVEVRDAQDRPGKEFVFVAARRAA
jgi:SAM-dependent methyltransferase